MEKHLNYIVVCPSDHQMDQAGPFNVPLNALPLKCPYCTFPDVDHVPQPYLLGKGITKPGELDVAELGNFFARGRARKVIEAVCPGLCEFYPTFDKKHRPTPWSLAVPVHKIAVGVAKPTIPRCPACGEAKTAHWGSQCDHLDFDAIGFDIVKSSNWFSHEKTGEEWGGYWKHVLKLKQPPRVPPHQWTRFDLGRWLYFSVRLEHLFKTVGIKGVVRTIGDKLQPDEADLDWVSDQFRKVAGLGLLSRPRASVNVKVHRWFQDYLKQHARTQGTSPDFSRVEKLLGKALPRSYKAFITKVGPKTFHDLDEMEGFEANIVGPDELDIIEFRQGAMEFEEEDEQSARIDGVLFASTGHGDAFCFDISGEGPEYPVYLYDHEMNSFVAYASNFEACIQRFAVG